MKTADLLVENHGSIFLLFRTSDAGVEWVRENIGENLGGPGSAVQTWGSAVVVEPRYIEDIVRGAQADGLEVR